MILNIKGQFEYEPICSINVGSNIIIPEGANLTLGRECYIGRYVELGPTHSIEIGDYTTIQDRCIFVGDVVIGRYCLFSLNVLISSGRHHYDQCPHLLIRDQDAMKSVSNYSTEYCKRVVIEDDCWIGVNTVIMPGVRIGKGSVIGANSVVTKDIPPFSVAAGTPAVVIKKRLDFNPPHEIIYDEALDLPYFYSGVELSMHERNLTKDQHGLFTKKKFQLALNSQVGSKIFLKVKSTAKKQVVTYQNKHQTVGNDFTEISFDIAPNAQHIHEFSLLDDVNSKLVIQKAWVA